MYYDDAWHRVWAPPAAKGACVTGVANGTLIDLKQGIDVSPNSVNSGGINPANLVRDPFNGCAPVYPHNMMRVNTIFERVRSAHGTTAYSEKRPSYDFLNGPSGTGVQDLYTPEIACYPFTPPATCNNALLSISATEAFDELRVQSVLHEIDCKDHTGTKSADVPTLFGMNFQSVNAAKKESLLPVVGGDSDDLSTPNADLAGALAYVDGAIGRFVAEPAAKGLTNTTAIIITAKLGETSLDPSNCNLPAWRIRYVES
jgi:hypothetical protein